MCYPSPPVEAARRAHLKFRPECLTTQPSNFSFQGGGLRRFMLGLYMTVNVLFTAVLVLMVIFAPIGDTLEKWKLRSIF